MNNKAHHQKKLLLMTSGGDSPGMNAAIRAIVRSSHYHGLKTYACHDGFHGMVEQKIFSMDPHDVAGCIQHGGTILRSGRSKEFHQKETRDQVRKFLKQEGIEYLVAIGGDGTYRGAALLEEEGGPKTIGVPGTIDNDIVGTEYTIGYDTARNNGLDAIDKIRDTAASSSLYFLVETMGRHSGFLAVDIGLAGGAEFIVTPEFPISVPELAKQIMAPKRKKQSLIIVVAEADRPGHSFEMAEALKLLTPGFDYRVCVLGHIQRGGTPTVMDRVAASIMGDMAVQGLINGQSKCMTAMQHGKYKLVPFPDPGAHSRRLTEDSLIKLNAVLAT
jgi:6-phosphofructokinase 1